VAKQHGDREELRKVSCWTTSSGADQSVEVVADVKLVEEEIDQPPRPGEVMRRIDQGVQDLRAHTPLPPIRVKVKW
jgi:hypothetical protein